MGRGHVAGLDGTTSMHERTNGDAVEMTSVVFATRDGARTLRPMLEALCGLDTPPSAYEIIAVDNGSRDDTVDVLESYTSRLPIRVLSCPSPGKNAALNLGVGQATGDLVVLTDDDVLPAPDWLSAFRDLSAAHPGVSVFGGRIVPEWPSVPPDWVLDQVDLAVCFAIHAETMEESRTAPWLIWGANMMVRGVVFGQGFRFHEGLGPSAGEYIMGGETEFVFRLLAAGHRSLVSPRPEVRHMIRQQQLTEEWLLGRARRHGRGRCVRDFLFPSQPNRPFGRFRVPLRSLFRAIASGGSALLAGGGFGGPVSFRARWALQSELAYLRQFRALSRMREAAGGRRGFQTAPAGSFGVRRRGVPLSPKQPGRNR